MKIKRFTAKGVNGSLNFDLKFNDDLTFVTGINGTGKTSALNSIAALICPRLAYLSTAVFRVMTLKIKHNKKTYEITAEKIEKDTFLTCTSHKKVRLKIPEFEPPDDMPPHRIRKYEEYFYESGISPRDPGMPIIQFLHDLPSPMYLGIERRSLSMDIDRDRRHLVTRSRSSIRKQDENIFSLSISQSLDDALNFAQKTFMANRKEAAILDEKVRKQLMLDLIHCKPISLSNIKRPTKSDFNILGVQDNLLQELPAIIDVHEDVIADSINPLFEFLEKRRAVLAEKPPKDKTSPDNLNYEHNQLTAKYEWSVNKGHISTIESLSTFVSKYNDDSETISKRSNEFLSTINSFLKDSGKTISFDTTGKLVFRLGAEKDAVERKIRTLSSGEIQLIVILTHLYFNPEVEKANVFIIDEPELSLHIQWQEKFVDSLMKASPNTQFIMATHSPSIIFGKSSECVEVSVTQ